MAKRKLNRGSKRPAKRKFLQGGSSYALPTSMAGTTMNLMGLGDPATLQKNLNIANAAIQENADRVKMQEEAKRLEQEQLSKEQFQNTLQQNKSTFGTNLANSLTTGINTARAAMGTAGGQGLTNLANSAGTMSMLDAMGTYGQAAQQGTKFNAIGQGIKAGAQQMGPGALGAGLGIAGMGLKHLSNDKDATTMNFGETAGNLLQGAGTGLGVAGLLGTAATGFGLPLALLGAAGYGINGLVQRNKAKVAEQNQKEQDEIARMQLSRAQMAANKNMFMSGTDMGFNTGNALSQSYTPSQQIMYKRGGLWDNIHAKRNRIANGSGEKMRTPGSKGAPTDEALKRSQMEMGGDPEKRAFKKQNRETRRAQKEFERKSKKGAQNIYQKGGQSIMTNPSQGIVYDMELTNNERFDTPKLTQDLGKRRGNAKITIDPRATLPHRVMGFENAATYRNVGIPLTPNYNQFGPPVDFSRANPENPNVFDTKETTYRAQHLMSPDSRLNFFNSNTNQTPNTTVVYPKDEYKSGGLKVPGGKIMPLPGQAVEFVGNKHTDGGIKIDSKTEVEGGETMDKVTTAQNKNADYIFSDYLKLGSKTFAQRHKDLLKKGASQSEIQHLAKLQEGVAAMRGEDGRDPSKIQMKNGGIKYQGGGIFPIEMMQIAEAAQNSPIQGLLRSLEMSGNHKEGPLAEENIYRPGAGYEFRHQNVNPENIDYEYEIGKSGFEGILKTPWAQAWGLPENMSNEDLEKFYRDTYVPRVQEYYRNNKDKVLSDIEEMRNYSDDPNVQNFLTKMTKADGSMLEGDELLEKAISLATDNKVGSWHSIMPTDLGETITPEVPEKEIPEKETPGSSNTGEVEEVTQKKKRGLPPWLGALTGLAGLQNVPTYPKARTIGAETSKMANLPRVNLNAERAANQAQNVATKRMFANQASGPAGMAAALAADQNTRAQGLQIGNQEARANKELMAQEASMNAQTRAQNASNIMNASMFNAQSLGNRDREAYEQGIYNKMHTRDTLTGVARDAMQYQSDERLARAMDDVGAYLRFVENEKIGSTPKKEEKKEVDETKKEETTSGRNGGYINKLNKVKRKKRK